MDHSVNQTLNGKRYNAYKNRNFEKFNHYKAKVKTLIHEAKSSFYKKCLDKNNIWKYIKSIKTKKTSVLDSIDDTKDAANKINDMFSSYFNKLPDFYPVNSDINSNVQPECWFTESCIESCILKLSTKKAYASTSVPLIFLLKMLWNVLKPRSSVF